MKTFYSTVGAIIALVSGAIPAHAQGTATWTNANSGFWNAATNWLNGRVPQAGDTVTITNFVTVFLNTTTPTLAALNVGESGSCGEASNYATFTGTSLMLSNNTLTLDGPLTVGTCGAVFINGGELDAVTNVNISGFVGFNGGTMTGTFTLTPGGMLMISSNLPASATTTCGLPNCVLTNNGTVLWGSSTIQTGESPTGTVIYNYGTWNIACDATMNAAYGASGIFYNLGTLLKSVGTSTNETVFASGVELTNSAAINVTAGTLVLNGGGGLIGGTATNLNGVLQLANGNFIINGTTTAATVIDAGGTLVGNNLIQGALTWSNGSWNGANSVVVSNTSTLVIDDAGSLNLLGGCLLVNNGTVDWLGGQLCGGNGEVVFNAGTWNCECDETFNDADYGGNIYFTNVGTFEKTASVNTTVMGTGLNFISTGTINVASGVVELEYGASLLGGTATNFAGLLELEAGNFTINGTVTCSNVLDDGGSLSGMNILQGALSWTNGDWAGSVATVSNGCTLYVEGGAGLIELGNCMLTNLGTVAWSSGHICGGTNAIVVNSGLWDCQGDMTFDDAAFGGDIYFTNTASGTLRKSAGVNSTVFGTGMELTSYGTIDTQSATLELENGGNLLGGTATNLNGTLQLEGGNFTINGAVTAVSVIQTGGNFVGNNAIQGALTWSNGNWSGSTAAINNNSTLFVNDNGGLILLGSCSLTNNGTLAWIAGHICGGGGENIYNYGTWNCECDQTFDDADFGGSISFYNYGTFEKTSSVNTTVMGTGLSFTNTGTINVTSGEISLEYGGALLGGTATNNSGLLELTGGAFTINGTVTGSNVWDNGAALAGVNVLQGALGWTNGNWNVSTVTISNGCTLYVEGGPSGLNLLGNCFLTNLGTVAWLSGHICGGSSEVINNHGLWNCEGDLTFDDADFGGNIYFTNFGTFRKSAGTNTTAVGGGTYFFNDGMLDAQTGAIALQNVFNLSSGTMNFGLNSLTNYGHISLTGTAVLGGGITANLNNGYVPIGGNSFNVVSFGSSTGAFTTNNLPFADAWGTNYTSTNFNLAVLNARPSITTPPEQFVDELTTMTATNTATDPDQPPQTLTFSLVSAPAGMTINSSTGVMTWTPPQTNSPSTNVVSVAVTDNGTPPLSATNSFTVIVIEVNQAPTLPAIANQTVDVLATLTVTNTATNSNIHSTNVGYKITGPSGVSITTNGIITWTPTQSQGPSTNTITTVVTNYNPYAPVNNYLTATNSFQVIVYAPTLAPISNVTNNPGQTVSFTASATDNDSTRTLTFSLGTAPAGATINSSSGLFSWRPPVADASTTNTVQVKVTANSTPSDTVTQSFDIVVRPLAPVTLTPVSETDTNFVIQIAGTAGPDYILQSLGSFQSGTWTNILTNTPGSLPFEMTATNVTATNGFYRIKLGP